MTSGGICSQKPAKRWKQLEVSGLETLRAVGEIPGLNRHVDPATLRDLPHNMEELSPGWHTR